jgi:hypothetical protein
MFLNLPALDSVTRYSYSVFDLAVALVVLGTIVSALRHGGRMALHSTARIRSPEGPIRSADA